MHGDFGFRISDCGLNRGGAVARRRGIWKAGKAGTVEVEMEVEVRGVATLAKASWREGARERSLCDFVPLCETLVRCGTGNGTLAQRHKDSAVRKTKLAPGAGEALGAEPNGERVFQPVF